MVSKEVGDDHWWKGESGGVTGLFPHCFVEREKFRVLHNYQAQNSDEISLQKGQVCNIFQTVLEYLKYFLSLETVRS